jgi:hypothetical protein
LTRALIPATKNKKLINNVDVFGRPTNNAGLNIEIYDDGSTIKKYFLK